MVIGFVGMMSVAMLLLIFFDYVIEGSLQYLPEEPVVTPKIGLPTKPMKSVNTYKPYAPQVVRPEREVLPALPQPALPLATHSVGRTHSYGTLVPQPVLPYAQTSSVRHNDAEPATPTGQLTMIPLYVAPAVQGMAAIAQAQQQPKADNAEYTAYRLRKAPPTTAESWTNWYNEWQSTTGGTGGIDGFEAWWVSHYGGSGWNPELFSEWRDWITGQWFNPDPAPVSDGLALMLVLLIVYAVWLLRKRQAKKWLAAIGLVVVSCGSMKAQGIDLWIGSSGIECTNDDARTYFTSLFENQFPDLYNHTFDVAGTSAVFDSLYLVTPIDDEVFTIVFGRDGNKYKWAGEADAVNDGNRIISNVDGKYLYFSGTCRNASAGTGVEREGFFQIEGHEAENVHLCLGGLNIKTKPKSVSMSFNDMMKPMHGMSCPVVISTDAETDNFHVWFHVRGENILTGGAKTQINANDGKTSTQLLASIIDMVGSPVAIRPMAELRNDYMAQKAQLHFDDLWPVSAADRTFTKRVNGMLDLAVEDNLGTPAIDLGNANGSCMFNGGRYVMHAPCSNSMFYVCSMSVCYKMMTLSGMSFLGVGSSMSTGSSEDESRKYFNDVIINDGTFTTHTASTDAVNKGWYRKMTDLRLPYNTKIEGGTFNNCDVYACDASAEHGIAPQNSAGKRLCRVERTVEATDIDPVLKTKKTPVAGYGSESLTPTDDNKIFIYLPDQDCEDKDEDYTRNWVTVIPKMGYEGVLTMGGDVTVYDRTLDDKPMHTSYMLYARLNDYTKRNAEINLANHHVKVLTAIQGAENKEFSGITNPGTFTIDKAIYMMLSFNSNEWNTLVAPFDVHHIYVLETTDTQKQTAESLDDFLIRQGTADGELAQTIVTSLCPDILSGKGSGVDMTLSDICTQQLGKTPFEINAYNPNVLGHDATYSHFYLYRQKHKAGADDDELAEIGVGEWDLRTDSDATQFSRIGERWDYVTPNNGVWMRRGRIYSIFLPADNNRYWDGKYLIFEGLGPQTLNNSHTPLVSGDAPDDQTVVLQGNNTFHNDTMHTTLFVPVRKENTQEYDFLRKEASEKYINLPGQVYAVVSDNNIDKVDMITRNGMIVWRKENTENTGLAAVEDNMLAVSMAEDAICMQAFVKQEVAVFAVDGTLLWQGTLPAGATHRLSVSNGVYIVHCVDNTKHVTYKYVINN